MATIRSIRNTQNVIIHGWWRNIRRNHRLFFRLMIEQPEHLALLGNLEAIIHHIERERNRLIFDHHPRCADVINSHLLAAERHFVATLRALQAADMSEAASYYDRTHAEMALLEYLFMERGLDTYLKR